MDQKNIIFCSFCKNDILSSEYKKHFEDKHVYLTCDICKQLVSISYIRAHISLHKIKE